VGGGAGGGEALAIVSVLGYANWSVQLGRTYPLFCTRVRRVQLGARLQQRGCALQTPLRDREAAGVGSIARTTRQVLLPLVSMVATVVRIQPRDRVTSTAGPTGA
jgi:hypothetical protein